MQGRKRAWYFQSRGPSSGLYITGCVHGTRLLYSIRGPSSGPDLSNSVPGPELDPKPDPDQGLALTLALDQPQIWSRKTCRVRQCVTLPRTLSSLPVTRSTFAHIHNLRILPSSPHRNPNDAECEMFPKGVGLPPLGSCF